VAEEFRAFEIGHGVSMLPVPERLPVGDTYQEAPEANGGITVAQMSTQIEREMDFRLQEVFIGYVETVNEPGFYLLGSAQG
jgi:hypothetical protein